MIHSILRKCWSRLANQQTYRFGIKTALLFVFLAAVVLTWYGNGLRRFANERRRFRGKWQLVNVNGELTIVSGKPIVIGFDSTSNDWTNDPTQQPCWLDFYTSRGVSHAIYEWVGGRLHIRQASPGLESANVISAADPRYQDRF